MRLVLSILFFMISAKVFAVASPFLEFRVEKRCFGDSTIFTDLSCCNIDTWSWDFGDPLSGSSNFASTRTAKHKYPSTGTYTVTLKIGSGGVLTDTLTKQIVICVPAKPVLNFHDTSICSGKDILLYSLNTFDKYYWNTGDTVRSIVINAGGKYILCSTNCDSTCLLCDTARVTILNAPLITLGKYTSVCKGDSFQLNARNAGFKYLWNTGDTTQKIWAKNDGWYTVKIYSAKCFVIDSTYLTFADRLTIEFNTDTSGCEGDTLLLNPGWLYKQVWWNYTDTNHVLKVYASGVYPLKIYYQGCFIDTFAKVNFAQPFALHLPNDTVLCDGDTLYLSAGVTAAKYYWSNGDTTQNTKIYTPDTVGLKVNFKGCYQVDTIVVNFIPKPILSPVSKVFTCEGVPGTININVPSGVNFKWWDGNANNNRTFSDTGWHRYEISNTCFIIPDSAYTGYYQKSKLDSLVTVNYCLEDNTILNLTAKKAAWYKWTPGGSTSQTIRVLKYGVYSIELTDSSGCKETDSFIVVKDCSHDTLFIPNAFSPNADGKNDIFKPTYVRHVNYEMRIYDRWGELLFKTNDMNEGWDGRYKSVPAQEDVYIYFVEVSGYGVFRQLKGTVHLIR